MCTQFFVNIIADTIDKLLFFFQCDLTWKRICIIAFDLFSLLLHQIGILRNLSPAQ